MERLFIEKSGNTNFMISCIMSIFIVFFYSSVAFGRNYNNFSINGDPLTKQEKKILKQAEAGKVADLGDNLFGTPRPVRASFLVKLFKNDFKGINIHPNGILIANALIKEDIDLTNIEIYSEIALMHCIFLGRVFLINSHFKKNLSLSKSKFLRNVFFQELKVDGSFSCAMTVFSKPSFFENMNIKGKYSALLARFEDNISFNRSIFNSDVILSGAKFDGFVNLSDIKVEKYLYLCPLNQVNQTYLKFRKTKEKQGQETKTEVNEDEKVTLIEAGHSLLIKSDQMEQKTSFEDELTLSRASIKESLIANNSIFHNTDKTIYFDSLKVNHFAEFNNVVFNGPVYFRGTCIGDDFIINDAKFLGNKNNFNTIKVGNILGLKNTVFDGETDFTGLEIGNQLQVGWSKFNNDSYFALAKIKSAILTNSEFKKLVIFADSNIINIVIDEVTWPIENDSILLDGLIYQNISAGIGPYDWKKMLKLVDNSRFNIQNYIQLDDYFQRVGKRNVADKIYIAGKWRECFEEWWWPINLLTIIFWGFLTGFGREPSRTFLFAFALVIWGAYLFDPLFIRREHWLSESGINNRLFARFLLSLDRFLPGVNLGLADLWEPSNVNNFNKIYWHIHKLLGWIIIPIGLAAIYTRIK